MMYWELFGEGPARTLPLQAPYSLLCTDCEHCFLALLCRFAASGRVLTKLAKGRRACSKVGKTCPLSALLQARTCVEAHAAVRRTAGWGPVTGTVLSNAPALRSS